MPTGAVLLALMVLYGGLFFTSGCGSKQKGTPDSPIEISTVDLYKQYKENKEEADKKYLNKTLEVTGILVSVSPSGEFDCGAIPPRPDSSTPPTASPSGPTHPHRKPEKAKIMQLKPGQDITVRGKWRW